MNDDYEGDFTSRRAIIYSLDFETRVRFYGPKSSSGFIRTVISDFVDQDTNALIEKVTTTTNPSGAGPEDTYVVTNTYSFPDVPEFQQVDISTSGTATFTANETITGSITGSTAQMAQQTNITNNSTTLKLTNLDSNFIIGDVVTGGTSGAFGTVTKVTDLVF